MKIKIITLSTLLVAGLGISALATNGEWSPYQLVINNTTKMRLYARVGILPQKIKMVVINQHPNVWLYAARAKVQKCNSATVQQ